MDDFDAPSAVVLVIVDPEDILYHGRPLRIRALAEALAGHISSGKVQLEPGTQIDYIRLAEHIEEKINSAGAVLQSEEHLRQLLQQVEAILTRLIEAEPLELFPSVMSVLRDFKESGCDLAWYSHCSRNALLALMEKLQWDALISFCSCTQDAGRNTTGGALADILENLQCFPGESLLISNNRLVLAQAREMKISSVACIWGKPPREVLSMADFRAESPQDLQEIIKKVKEKDAE